MVFFYPFKCILSCCILVFFISCIETATETWVYLQYAYIGITMYINCNIHLHLHVCYCTYYIYAIVSTCILSPLHYALHFLWLYIIFIYNIFSVPNRSSKLPPLSLCQRAGIVIYVYVNIYIKGIIIMCVSYQGVGNSLIIYKHTCSLVLFRV